MGWLLGYGPRPLTLAQILAQQLDRPGGDAARRALALIHGAAVAGRFDAVRELVPLARERGLDQQSLEEAALQVVAYGGFPRAIETLGLIAADRPDGDRSVIHADDPRPAEERAAAGRATWESIYGANAERVLAELDRLMAGFHDLVLGQAYAAILSRPGLPLGLRELLAVAALGLAGLARPLESHMRGALHNGFAPLEVQDILLTCTPLADDHARTVIDQAVDHMARKVYSR